METAAKIYEEGKKANKDVVQVNPAWVLEESLKSLSSKFPILPRSQGSLTFCTTPLSSKLESKPEDALFDLADANVLRYNVLHDSHLKEYFQNSETRRRLVEQGFITEDGYVICNLVEFNNFRKWIRKLKLEELYKQRRHIREEEINRRNTQLMAKKLEREKECLHILRERERKAKEYTKKKKEKRDHERKKYLWLQEIEMRKREKKRQERRNQLDDVEEEREKRQVERKVENIIREDKKRKIRLRIVRKRKQEDIRRDAALNERRHLGRCQRDKELKKQWKRRCTIALGHITEKWKDENQLLELRGRNIERRAKMYQKRQTNSQESVINFVKTRRATLHQEFLEAEEFFNKLRMRKDIEIANWKRKHERMLSRGSSITSVQHKGSRIEGLDEYMALRRWSEPNRAGFRRRLKSTWDLKSSLIKDLEEESPCLAREEDDQTREKERMEKSSKTDVRVNVRSLIKNIINNAHNVFEEEKKRTAVKSLVGEIIDSAVAVVEKEETNKRNRTCVRRYVFSVIEDASQTLEKERREAMKAKMIEEEAVLRVKEQMNRIAAQLVSAATVFAKRRVDKDVEKKATEDDEEIKDTAKWIVGTAIERAFIRFKGQVQDISRVSSESLPESIAVDTEEVDVDDSRLDWAVRNIVSDAVATAVDSMECLYYKECDLMEAAMGLMNSAMRNAQESLENMHRVTPALEEQINRTAWRLANRALISAENALEKQREESIEQATQELTSHAIPSAQNSFARMEEQMLCEAAEELALQAIMKAQKSLRKSEEEELFSQELAKRAIMEAKKSLVRADEIERTSLELTRQAIELAQVSSQNILKDRADEAKKIAVAAAERCIEAYKSQENLSPEDDLIATEALKLAIQAINSAQGSLEEVHPRTTCVLTDGKLLSGVMQYVEGIIVRALQELESNKDINVLKPGNIQPDVYNVLSQSDTSLHRKSFVKDNTSFAVPKESETAKAATSSRRRSSVHFNATNIFSNRKDSLSRDSDHLKARNRPPTPRFLAQRSFTNQLACASWDNLEEKLKHIENKDRVKTLLSTRKGSPTFSERKRLHLRRFSSDQSIAMKRGPVVVSFHIPHSSSDNSFRRASRVQDSQLVKEMLDSSNEGEDDLLDAKEHRECEFDTLVSMTNTPEPQAFKGYEDDILQTITSDEERIPCQIIPRSSSYILLPKLEIKDQVLLQPKVTEFEQIQRCVETSSTHLPAVSPTTSLVMVEDADGLSHTKNETKTLPTQKHTNLPKISQSGSLVSIEREPVTKDFDHERVTKVSEDKNEVITASVKPSQTEGPLVLKPSNEVASVPPNDVAMEVSPKTFFESSKMSPRLSSQSMKKAPTEATKVSPKQSREAREVLPKSSSDSTKMINIPSTQTDPAPSSESLSPRPSKKRIAPITSTESARVSPKLSIKTTTDSPKASSEYIQTEKTTSAEAAIISPKPSSDGLRELIKFNHPMKEAQDSVTEAATLSPKPSGESSKLLPKASSESQKMTQVPSTEAKTLSPKSSIPKTDMAEKDESAETEITAPKISTVECKVPKETTIEATNVLSREPSKKSVILTPSTEAAEVSSKSSLEAAKISPKASGRSTKIIPVSSTEAVGLPFKTSRKDVKVSPKVSTESTKMAVCSTEGTRMSPKVSTETAKLLLEASESAKITTSLLGEEADVSPKTSIDGAELLPKASSETKKMAPVASAEAAKIYSKNSTEDTLLKKDLISESKMVASTTSSEVHKISSSTEPAKLLSEVSKQSLTSTSLTETVEVSPKASSKSAKITPTPSSVGTEVPSKSLGKDVKVLMKDSSASAIMAAIPSLEKTQVSTKLSSEAVTVSPKASRKSAKIAPTPSTVIAESPSKLSGKDVKVLSKDSCESSKVAAIPSTEKTQVSPKHSSAAAKVLPKASNRSAKITPTASTVTVELPSKPSNWDVEVSPKDFSGSSKMAAVLSSEKTQVSPKLSSEATKLTSKSSSESAKIKQTTSVEKTKETSIEDTKTTKMTPALSTKAAILSPQSTSSEAIEPSPKASKIVSTTTPNEVANVASKLSSDSIIKSKKMKHVFSGKVSSEPLSQQEKLLPKASSESTKMAHMASAEDVKVTSKPSSEVKRLLPTSSSGSTRMTHRKLTSRSLAEVTPKPSSETAKHPKRSSSMSTKMTSEPSIESVKMSTKSSTVKTQLSSSDSTRFKPSTEAKVSTKPSIEVTDLLSKASGLSTKTTPKPSTDVMKVSPKPSSEAGRFSSQTSQLSTKMTSMESKETIKQSPKSSMDSAKLSSRTSSTSTKMVPSSPSKEKVSRKPSREASKLSTKTSTASTKTMSEASSEPAKVSSKHSGDAGILTPKASSVSTKMTASKASSTFSKMAPTSSTDTAQVSAKHSTKSIKLSKKTSSGSTKATSTHSTGVKASPKPSQVSGESSKRKMIKHETGEATTKSSTQITSPSQQDLHEHQTLTSRASKGDSKLSLKRSRESSILSSKASRESHKKKHKHHKIAPKKVSGETIKLTHKPSSQSTEMSPEVSPRASQVSQMSSIATKDLVSEGSDVSSKTSRETIKDVTGGKMTSTESGENVASESVERIAQTPSRKASKAKHTSQSLIKVSSKTQSQDPKASVSASVVSTYAIETPMPATKVDSVPMDNASTYSSKSLNKLPTQGLSYEDKRGSQEKLPEISDSRLTDSQLSHKDRPHEEGNRRISLSVPDQVVALKGVGRRTSLPGGAVSEHEFERRRLSSLHDISESRESNEASCVDDSTRKNEDHSLEDNQKSIIDTLTFADAENRRLSLMRSIPSITIQEPASPPNDENVVFEEDERVRIICELEHTHPVSSDEQIAIDNSASGKASSNQGSYEAIRKTSDPEALKQSKSSIPDIHNENVSDVIKVHQPSEDIASPSQTGSETPKRQSVTCIGIQFSPTCSKDHILPNRASEVSLKTRIAKGSISKIGQEGIGVREPLSDSFELKGVGLAGERRSSARALISSRSTEFPRTRPFQVSRGHFSSHSLDTPLSRGVIVTPLKPSPPLSPRLIESSTRRSRLKMALSQQRAKETQSETSLTSSKSETGDASPKKGSETLLGSNSPANNSSASNESAKTLPERPSTASGMLKREKIKASRAIISSSSSERSDTSAHGTSDGNVNQQA